MNVPEESGIMNWKPQPSWQAASQEVVTFTSWRSRTLKSRWRSFGLLQSGPPRKMLLSIHTLVSRDDDNWKSDCPLCILDSSLWRTVGSEKQCCGLDLGFRSLLNLINPSFFWLMARLLFSPLFRVDEAYSVILLNESLKENHWDFLSIGYCLKEKNLHAMRPSSKLMKEKKYSMVALWACRENNVFHVEDSHEQILNLRMCAKHRA